MDLATTLSIVQTILTAIQTLDQLKGLFSFTHHEMKLQSLRKTVTFVQAVLEDADAKHGALNSQQMTSIEELKDAVYDANDVLDGFVTLVKRKHLAEASTKFFGKVKSSLSRLLLTHKLSKEIEKVNGKLDRIASDASKFKLDVNYNPTKFIKPESSHFVPPNDPIIGRDEELKSVRKWLVEANDVNVSSLAIVGMGGLGKTAFAQFVYSDLEVTNAFELKCWTCIGDQEKDKWNLPSILGKILKELDGGKTHNLTSLPQIQQEVVEQLSKNKYFLVLDDVWTENRYEWRELERYLMVGKSGSRIVVTTRSEKTAEIIEGVRVLKLKGLPDDESWRLFKTMAFRQDQREHPGEDLEQLAKEIVKKCFNVPLAIRVVGSLLYNQPKPTWLSFRDKELANITKSNDTMTNILSLSYHHLDSSLKSCFAYCAIFPKDYMMKKQQLIWLWMAHGYINLDDEGEEYFRILLQRCFFQEVMEIKYDGKINEIYFKMHDLLHEIAEKVSGKEVVKLDSNRVNVDSKVRHLSLTSDDCCREETFHYTHIHTLFNAYEYVNLGKLLSINLKGLRSVDLRYFNGSSLPESVGDRHGKLLSDNLIRNLKCLRSLDLRYFNGSSLPESIGDLFHLRFLDLSWSRYLEVLPKSITNLINLQTLDLSECCSLIKLPEDIYKLVDLTTLDLTNCVNISHVPSSLGMLKKLHTLGQFVVTHSFQGLEDLGSLNNLKGFLEVVIKVDDVNAKYKKEDHGGGAYLIHKHHLNEIRIKSGIQDEAREWEQSLWEDMQPPVDIKCLSLWAYMGETMPRWPRMEDASTLFYFPYLVTLNITSCHMLRALPPLQNLPHLKILSLYRLKNIEYIVNVNLLEVPTLGEESSFFPCLEHLTITELPKLKGWWPGSEEQNEPLPCFANLWSLDIHECDMLNFVPISSSLKTVWLNSVTLRMDMERLPESYKALLPQDSKSRFITTSDLEESLNKNPS